MIQRRQVPRFALMLVMFLLSSMSGIAPFQIPSEWGGWVGCIDQHIARSLLPLQKSTAQQASKVIVKTTIDLGKSTSDVELCPEGVSLAGNLILNWDEVSAIADKESCWAIYDDGSKPYKVSVMSKNTNIPASLCAPLAGTGAPTMVLGGFTMHRIVGDGMNPMVDTSNKLASVAASLFKGGVVLDTCMGLGYTCLAAAERVTGNGGRVITVEYDEASLEMASYNPWSKGLFDQSLPIEIMLGDSCEVVREFKDSTFNAVIHDPPARALCRNDLYGLGFYRELRRVLKPNGILFHYIGKADSRESGRLYKGIQERLQEAGM